MLAILSRAWILRTCMLALQATVSNVRAPPHYKLWGNLPAPAPQQYEWVNGTQNRFAIDMQCSKQEKEHLLQGFRDAQQLASAAAKWPLNGYGIAAMDLYMGPFAHENHSFVEFASRLFGRAAFRWNLPSRYKVIVIDCKEYVSPSDYCDLIPRMMCYVHNGVRMRCCRPYFNYTYTIAEVEASILFKPSSILDMIIPELAGRVILHELLHTKLITYGQPLTDTRFRDVSMYGPQQCKLAAISQDGGGLPLCSQNADSYAHAASTMFWEERLQEKRKMPSLPWWIPPFCEKIVTELIYHWYRYRDVGFWKAFYEDWSREVAAAKAGARQLRHWFLTVDFGLF